MKDEHDSAATDRRARTFVAKPDTETHAADGAKCTEASAETVVVVGGGRSGTECAVNAGELPEQDTAGCPAEVRAAIVATKPGNAGGAKGGRKANPSLEGDREEPSSSVPPKADKQGEEDLWATYGAERGIWTKKMLAALARGLEGAERSETDSRRLPRRGERSESNQWFSLIDKVVREETLAMAWAKVQSNAGACGVDGITVERFAKDSLNRLLVVKEHLKRSIYQPTPVKRVWIPKPGSSEQRPLGIPTVRDRVVQCALRMVVEPIFEREFAPHSYGVRPGRSCHHALRRVEELLRSGYGYVVEIDIKGYFDAIPHERLMERVGEKIADGRVLELIERFLTAGVMEGMQRWEAEKGAPQGAVISPLLANIYLNPLDWLMQRAGMEMVRYADDLVVLCRDPQSAQRAMEMIQQWMGEEGLELNLQKSRITDMTMAGGHFDFLGYRFWRSKDGRIRRFVRPKSKVKLRERIKPLTRRCNRWDLGTIISRINPILRGWYGYFKQASADALRDTDGWVRGRLRAILRKRRRGKGRGRGADHQRWNNRYFHALGLFSLEETKLAELASLRKGATC
jgi:RNA-directed DNA polymerase